MLLTPRLLRGLLGMLIIVKNLVNNTTLVRLGCGIFTSKTSSIAPPSITVTMCQVPFTQRLPLNNCWHPKLILAIFFGNSLSRSRSEIVTDSAFPVLLQDKLISTYLEKTGCVVSTQSKVIWWTIERVFSGMNHRCWNHVTRRLAAVDIVLLSEHTKV